MSNTITIEGWIARDPELRFTPSGKAALNFSLPENHGYKDQQTGEWKQTGTTWRAVTLWGDDATYASEILRKGDLVQVTGREKLETFQRQDGTEGSKLALQAFTVAKVLKAPKQPRDGYQDQQQGGYQQAPQQQGYQQKPQGTPQADPWSQQAGGNYNFGQPQQDANPPF